MASSTAWHPQTDRQTERVNQELDQYLRLFVNERQDDWYNLLPIVEFQHNNHVHSATQQPPFLLDTGWLPRMGFEPRQNSSGLETVNEFTERMRTAIKEAKSMIRKAQDDMKKYYDRRRTPAPVFKQSLPRRIGHLDYALFAETLASMTRPLCSRKTDQTYGLLLKTPTLDKATPSSIQRSKAHSGSG